jgi:hypothetical protein
MCRKKEKKNKKKKDLQNPQIRFVKTHKLINPPSGEEIAP